MDAPDQKVKKKTKGAIRSQNCKEGCLEQYSPIIVAIVLYIALIGLIWVRYPPSVMAYVTDIFNASAMAETGRLSVPMQANGFKGIAFVGVCILWSAFVFRIINLLKIWIRHWTAAAPPTKKPAGLRMAQYFLLTTPEAEGREKKDAPAAALESEETPRKKPKNGIALLRPLLALWAAGIALTAFIFFAGAGSGRDTRFYVTYPWIVSLLTVLSAWAYSFYHIYALNQDYRSAGCKKGQVCATRFALDWLRFVLLPFLVIALVTIALYHFGKRVDEPIVAMIGAGSLIGFFSVTQAYGQLGRLMRVGWFPVNMLRWFPIAVLVVALTSQWWPESKVRRVWNPNDKYGQAPNVPVHSLFPTPPTPQGSIASPAPVSPAALCAAAENLSPAPVGSVPKPRPLVIICASGGGSRAAIFTAGMLTRLWEQDTQILEPVNEKGNSDAQTAESEDRKEDSRLRKYWREETRKEARLNPKSILFEKDDLQRLYPGRLLLQSADVISSVSGGSLASAYFVERLFRQLRAAPSAAAKKSSSGREAALRTFFDPADKAALHPPARWYNTPKRSASPKTAPDVPLDFSRGNQFELTETQFRAFDTNPYINAMRQNYVAPIFCGFFQPWIGRGPRYEDTWSEYFGWRDKDAKQTRRLSEFAPYEQRGALPALILNSTLTRTGARLAFTNLCSEMFEPLGKLGPESGYFGARLDGADSGRYDPLPGRIVTHSYLDAKWDVPLATAVHASANFPGALPAMQIQQYAPAKHPADAPQPIRVWDALDGGIDDNYGIDSVMALLRRNRKAIRERGVLIFQIDPSFMSLNPEDGGGITENITLASNAAWRSSQNEDATLGNLYLRELCALFQCQPPYADIQADAPSRGDDTAEFTLEPMAVSAQELAAVSPQAKKVRQARIIVRRPYFIGYTARPTRRAKKPFSRGFAFFKVRLGEAPLEQVLTYWHLDDAERDKIYRGLCAEQNGKAILAAARWLRKQMQETP